MITIDEIDVCMPSWMHIAKGAESTFYHYQKYALKDCREARKHGNSELLKLRQHTEKAIVTLKYILENEADHMSHCTYALISGQKVVSRILPAIFQWKGQMKKKNEVNAALELKEISTLNLNKMRSSRFPKYNVKQPGDNFARCAECKKLWEIIKSTIAGYETAMLWSRRLDRHLAIVYAHRKVYYAN